MMQEFNNILATIDSPDDLKSLSTDQLLQLCQEIRDFICQTLNQCGGHFAANLGTVELAVALHTVYQTPQDQIIWDVGHQAYPHKILTGRKARLHSIRQYQGLAPFPKRDESEYDTFGVGHSSTSISAALGFSLAMQLRQQADKSVAIIGDGAMTAGMAFEALNHAGDCHADLLVILNDNDMSISNNVGALSKYLSRLLSGKIYTSVREGSKKMLRNMPPPLWDFMKKTEQHVKGMIVPGTLFEELGFNYIGPTDGHDLPSLLKILQNLRTQKGPKLLHVVTCKGKGYPAAEQDPIRYHAVKPGFLKPATTATKTPAKPTFSNIFGTWLCDMAAASQQLVAITPAMCEGSDLVEFARRYPDRYHDVGIAEQHAVTLAAGFACQQVKPVVAIYSTFLQRAYDQLIHDVCLQNLPVLFAIDRAGLVGGDGTTHNGSFDISFLRCLPNLILMTPSDEALCRAMLTTGFQYDGPACVRYPRGTGTGIQLADDLQALPIGKAKICRQGKQIAILAFGTILHSAQYAADGLNASLVDMRFVKPLDETLLKQLATTHDIFVTVEENAVAGGAGSAVNEFCIREQLPVRLLNIGLPDQFVHHGDPKKLLADLQLDKQGIQQQITAFLSSLEAHS